MALALGDLVAAEIISVECRVEFDRGNGMYEFDMRFVATPRDVPDINALMRSVGGPMVLMSKSEYEDMLTLGSDDA